MAPLLILVFGVPATTAIGTDLWFAGTTKTVGGAIHHTKKNADLKVVARLMSGAPGRASFLNAPARLTAVPMAVKSIF